MLSNIIKLKNLDLNKSINDNNNPYIEFKSTTPMTITPKYKTVGVSIQYSLDTETWYGVANNTATPSATTVYFRGRATGAKSLNSEAWDSGTWAFTGASQLEVNGNITMLLQDEYGENIPDIPLNKYAFSNMFNNCTSLTVAPSLPSTTLADYCYDNMFNNCTSLVVAPELPATTLASYCYLGMFYYCTSLTVAPELPATTLANNCYQNMFNKCTSLTVAPELPATTLTNGCYSNMFQNCTSLTVAPELPATTLANNCYNSMFYWCTSLKFSLTKNGEYQKEYRIPKIGTISSEPTGWSTYMFRNTGGTFKGTPTINTTYYVPNGPIQ